MKFYELWKIIGEKEQWIKLKAGNDDYYVTTKYALPKDYDECEVKKVTLGRTTEIEVAI